ncbi:MAG TPA: hypothetical protein ENH62_06805 [Marinobacter sp.]|nr:hypothetical protein [Marinobacter sp.]
MSKRLIHLSASSIGDYKACVTRFMAKYICGLRRTGHTESQRRGLIWHTLQEILYGKPGGPCPLCCDPGLLEGSIMPGATCAVCDCTGVMLHDTALKAAQEHLCKHYEHVPSGVEPEAYETERAKLLYALHVYNWYWNIQSDGLGYEVVATEVPFKLPILNPDGNVCRDAILVGKIDKIIRFGDTLVGTMEHKSTTRDIDPNAEYWNKLIIDTQTTMYPYALARMQKEGQLEKYGIMPDHELPVTTLYDVTRMPAIKMKALSQAETNSLIETGEYCGAEFDIDGCGITKDGNKKNQWFSDRPTVDGCSVTIVEGKKASAFRETENMYGARVFRDMTENPEEYFQRREITRTTDELARFEGEIYSIYKHILYLRKTGYWYKCEGSCERPFKCDYALSYCYVGEEISRDNVLEGFELIW